MWSVLNEMSKYPATPSHESNMPNFTQSSNDYGAKFTRLQTTPGLDVEAELIKLRNMLDADFSSSQPFSPTGSGLFVR
jgi:hypothetical protein